MSATQQPATTLTAPGTTRSDRATLDRVTPAIRVVTTAIMAAGFGFFGLAKVAKLGVLADGPTWSRLSETQWAAIGVLEIVAVISLVLALSQRFRVLGVAAATGLATLAASAVVFHVANSDPASDIVPAVLQGLVATTYAVVGGRQLRAR